MLRMVLGFLRQWLVPKTGLDRQNGPGRPVTSQYMEFVRGRNTQSESSPVMLEEKEHLDSQMLYLSGTQQVRLERELLLISQPFLSES